MAQPVKGGAWQPTSYYPTVPGLRRDLEGLRTWQNPLRFNSEFFPSETNRYSLGEPAHQWRYLHARGIRIGTEDHVFFEIGPNKQGFLTTTVTVNVPYSFGACFSFAAGGGFRLPRRASGASAGTCSGPGQLYSDTDDDSLNADLGSGTKIIARRPTGTTDALAGVDGPWRTTNASPPTISPVNSGISTDYGDATGANLALGTTGGVAAGTAIIHLNPEQGTATPPRLTVIPKTSGSVNEFVLNMPFAGTASLTVQNDAAGPQVADVTATGITNGIGGAWAGPAGNEKIRLTQLGAGGIGTLRNDALGPIPAGGNIEITPGGGSVVTVGTHDIGAVAGTRVRISSASITTAGGNLTIDSAGGTVAIDAQTDIGETAATRVTIDSGTIGTLSGNLTISAAGAGVVIVADTLQVGSNATNRVVLDSDATNGTITTLAGDLFLSAVGGDIVHTNTVHVGPSVVGTLGSWSAATGLLTTRHHYPQTDATYDLGQNATTLRWRDLFLSGGITVPTLTVTTITTPATNTDLTINPDGTGQIITVGVVRPTGDNADDLGATATRYRSLYLGTSLLGTGSIAIDLATNAATTLTIQNTNGSNVCHVTIDGGLSVGAAAPAPASGVMHAISTRGGSSTVFGIIRDSGAGAPVVTSNSGVGTLFLATNDAAGGPGTVSVPLDNFQCSGTITSTGNINSTGGVLQTNSTTRITNAGSLNNCLVDGGATGNSLRLKNGTPTNNFEITWDDTASALTVKDSGGVDHAITF